MKIVLFAMNGSYSHTNLAVRCLRAALEKGGFSPVIIEANLRDRRDEVLQRLYAESADVYGFSCYIWNITEMLSLAEDLSALLPRARMVFGGPEVSFDTERFDDMKFIHHIICGEGERVIVSLCRALEAGNQSERILHGELAPMDDGGILYRDGDYEAGDMLYYESSRGCPYACAYCLSSVERGIRAKSVERTLTELLEFERLEKNIKVIKFVDRTFNFDVRRANAIWDALADERYSKKYHFEICASLLDEDSYRVLSKLPRGKVQLEIGLQSTNPHTLAAVSRHIEPTRVIAATERLHKMGNIHVPLDLIAGLPHEDYESFKCSFNDAYDCCDILQLGFLKLLHGTALRKNAAEFGCVFSAKPPYTVLATDCLGRDELYRLSQISDLLDRYYSSGKFKACLSFAVGRAKKTFDFYEGLLAYLMEHEGRGIRKLSQTDAFRVLYGYVKTFLDEADAARFETLMHEDFAAHEARKLPLSVVRATHEKRQAEACLGEI